MTLSTLNRAFCLVCATVACVLTSVADDSEFRFTCLPYLQNVTPTEATIVWHTDRDAVSWVETAPDDGSHFYAAERPKHFDTSAGKKKIGTLHRVTLRGLTPGTTYRYRVFSEEVTRNVNKDTRYGGIIATNVYREQPLRFTTPRADGRGARFAVVNDIHQHKERYTKLFHAVDSASLDFMVLNGDMVNSMDSLAQSFNGFLNRSSKIFATSIPFYMVRGNHETRGTRSQDFADLFPTPTGNPYYAVRHGDVCFLMLDAGEDKPDSDIEYNGLAAFDDYRSEQAEWLRRTVDSDMFRTASTRIVFIHVPPIGNGWHGLNEVNEKFIPILNEAGIDLMLSGHIHRHKFIPQKESGFAFPLLINSNREILDVDVKDDSIAIDVFAEDGRRTHQYTFPKNH